MAVEMELHFVQQNLYYWVKAKNPPNEKVAFHLKINLFLELGIDFLTNILLELSEDVSFINNENIDTHFKSCSLTIICCID
jgi:hypothetical protein